MFLIIIFRNLNNFGNNEFGHCVDEVELPKWAENEHDFIRINREALESKYVRENLGAWIDQLYGKMQKQEDKMNIFF